MRSKGAVAIADAVKEGLHKLKVLCPWSRAFNLLKMPSFPFHGFLSILLPLLIILKRGSLHAGCMLTTRMQ